MIISGGSRLQISRPGGSPRKGENGVILRILCWFVIVSGGRTSGFRGLRVPSGAAARRKNGGKESHRTLRRRRGGVKIWRRDPQKLSQTNTNFEGKPHFPSPRRSLEIRRRNPQHDHKPTRNSRNNFILPLRCEPSGSKITRRDPQK